MREDNGANEAIRQRMTTTPAQALPRLVPPADEPPMAKGVIAEILERLARVEDELGIHRPGKPHEPLPGSDVRPLTEGEH